MSALIGHIAAFLSNLFFGLSIPVTKELLSSWLDPIGYTLLRALSAAVIFWTASFFLPREKVAGRDLAIIAAGVSRLYREPVPLCLEYGGDFAR